MPEHQDLAGAQLHAPGEHAHPAYLSGIQYRDVQLNDDQIKALPTTQVEIIPAPGAGLMLKVFGATVLLDARGGAYATVSAGGTNPTAGDPASLYLAYGNGDEPASAYALVAVAVTPHLNVIDLPAYTSWAGGVTDWPLGADVDVVAVFAEAINLIANNALGNFTGGNPANTLSIRVWYAIVPAVPFGV